jgi:hypothetical protein
MEVIVSFTYKLLDIVLEDISNAETYYVVYIDNGDLKWEVTLTERDDEIILEDSQQLDEITIKSEAPPIRIKKDTLEFNDALSEFEKLVLSGTDSKGKAYSGKIP